MEEDAPGYRDATHRLANLLDLNEQWWTGCHVNDRSSGPCNQPGYAAHDGWHTCRAVRNQLLAALTPAVQPERGERQPAVVQ